MMVAGVGMLMNLFFVGLIVAAVMKLFQIHTTLTEIKDQLSKTPAAQPAPAYVQPAYSQPPPAQHYEPAAPTVPQAPAAQPSLLRMPPAAPTQQAAPVAPLVGDTRSGEEMLRDLDQQMRLENVSRPFDER